MKVEMIDLEEFFNYKYKKMNIGATGVITDSQMVTRFNNTTDGQIGKGLHFDTECDILADIFDIDGKVFSGFGYDKEKYESIAKEYRRLLHELIVIKYLNNVNGNLVIIYLPLSHESLTSKQLEVFKYISTYYETVARKLRSQIKIMATNRHDEGVRETNTMRNKIIPYLEGFVDDNYKQSIEDKNIIAQKVLHL